MKIEDVKRVLIIGAGTMGQEIGILAAVKGFDVVLYDVNPKAFDQAQKRMEGHTQDMVAAGYITAEEAPAALNRITMTIDLAKAAEDVDVVSESILEDPKLKGKVFGQLNTLCPERTIFTTNTSSLVPSQYAKLTGRPAQFAALHFHPHVWDSNVVDLMPHPGTSGDTIEFLRSFSEKLGQIVIFLKKEQNSYVFNTMLSAVLGSAMELVVKDVASYEDVDRAWIGIFKMPAGPFGLIDHIGIDTVYHISKYWADRLFFIPKLRKQVDFLEKYVKAGKVGVKSGEGFYKYPNPEFLDPGFLMRSKTQ